MSMIGLPRRTPIEAEMEGALGAAKGAYILIIELTEPRYIEVGKLGAFLFPYGYYSYSGSAMGGIYRRVERHLKREKKLRWHIDYFLELAEIREALIFESETKIECMVNRRVATLLDGKIIAPGFGSTDCREGCKSHLLSIPECKDGIDPQTLNMRSAYRLRV
ncbi:MAG: GIY-YIG nuclease family protein [Candidatus Dadabacteria bacterium]|nr:GIY-YIG nuclease family protein [Candidatus Dadabacteria bacterium]